MKNPIITVEEFNNAISRIDAKGKWKRKSERKNSVRFFGKDFYISIKRGVCTSYVFIRKHGTETNLMKKITSNGDLGEALAIVDLVMG